MRLYFEVAVRAFRRATVYRLAMISGILTSSFFGVVLTSVYLAVLQARGAIAGFDAPAAVTYVWLMQALIAVNAGWISWELAQQIRSGDVITELTRPWSFYGYWLSRTLGAQAYGLGIRGVFTYLVGVMLFGAGLPGGWQALAFAASLVLAMLVITAYGFIMNMTAMWLLDYSGALMMGTAVQGFFSGFLVPLAFFPEPLQPLVRALPFQAMSSMPALVFLGQVQGREVLVTLGIQAFWVLALTALALLVERAALRKVVIQGG